MAILFNSETIAMAKSISEQVCGTRRQGPVQGQHGRTKLVKHKIKSCPFVVSKARFDVVMEAAEQSGLLSAANVGDYESCFS